MASDVAAWPAKMSFDFPRLSQHILRLLRAVCHRLDLAPAENPEYSYFLRLEACKSSKDCHRSNERLTVVPKARIVITLSARA